MNDLCPCGSNRDYTACCGAIINGKREAITCLDLMKSRYSAYVKADINYLMLSHSAKTRPKQKERADIKQWAESVKWIQLVIENTWNGNAGDNEGHVAFKALYFENGQMQQIYEKSLFRREQGRWVYVSGVHY